MESKKLLKLLVNMSDEMQDTTLENMIQRYHIFKDKIEYQGYNRAKLYRLALLHELEKMYSILYLGYSKKFSRNLNILAEQTALREKMINTSKKRSPKKRDKILGQYCPLIYELRFNKKKEFSWIVAYLKRFHKFQVDDTYLFKLYPLITEKMKNSLDSNPKKDK